MNLKKINEFMAYLYFAAGMVKLIYIIMVFMQFSANIVAIFNGGEGNNGYFPEISFAIGITQIILGIVSIIMIFICSTRQPEVISGYFWGLGALALEFIVPNSLFVYVVFAQCGMYIRAGIKIRNGAGRYEDTSKNKKLAKNTEWFYNEQNDNKVELSEGEMQNIMDKLQPEIQEWKKLLSSGMIDEDMYNKEINKMINKEKKKQEKK